MSCKKIVAQKKHFLNCPTTMQCFPISQEQEHPKMVQEQFFFQNISNIKWAAVV
jgi:hypothetical protein